MAFAIFMLTPGTGWGLTAGDIAILGVNADATKSFAFVALTDIPANTKITFTDNAWTAAAGPFATTEGSIEWTHTSIVSAGTVITLTVDVNPYLTTLGTITTSTNFNLSTSGDQIIAFADTWTNRPTTASDSKFLYAFSLENFITSSTTSSNTSYLPSALSGASVAMTTSATETDNAYFANGSTVQTTVSISGTKAELLALFNDASKYYQNNTGPLTFPTYTITVNSGSVTAPTIQAFNITFSSIGQNAITTNWTNGDGAKRVVKINTLNSFTAPADGTDPTANTVYSGSGEQVVFNGSGNSVAVTGLTASTTYWFRVYEYNGSGATTKYLTTTATNNPNSQVTAAPTPTITLTPTTLNGFNYVAGFGPSAEQSFTVLGTSLTNDVSITASANYEISKTSGSGYTTPLTFTPAEVATAQTIYVRLKAGLTAGNYNSEVITASSTGATNSTVTCSGSVSAFSNLSDIIANASYTYTSDIDYTIFQTATITNTSHSVGVFQFTIRDGGATAPDVDAAGTELTAITFNVTNSANIRSAALFFGNAMINNAPNINAGTIAFSGMSGVDFTAVDNDTKNLTLRVSFNTTVTDNQQMQFTIASATASAAGSGFATANAGGAQSSISNDRNRIEVTASQLAYTQQPTTTSTGVAMTPAVTIAARDANNNTDLDFTDNIRVSSNGTMTGSPVSVAASNGVATFSTLTHTAAGTGLILTAERDNAGAWDWDLPSNGFDIILEVIPNNSYRTATPGTWPSSGTATWERYVSGTWGTSTAPPQNSSDNLYIRHTITSNNNFAAATPGTIMIIESGGTLNVGHQCTFGALTIKAGGVFSANSGSTVTVNSTSGTFTVESGGLVNINNNATSGVSAIWGGTEDFQAGSTVNIQNWNYGVGNGDNRLIQNPSIISANADGYYFGNLVISGAPSTIFVMSEGTQTINLCKNNFTASSTGSNVAFNNALSLVTIGGNVTVTTGALSINASGSTGTCNSTILGNLVSTGGIINLNQNSSGTTTAILNLKGNLTIPAGTTLLSATDAGSKIVFNGSGTQEISIISTLGSNVEFEVASTTTAKLINQNLALTTTSNLLSVLSGGTLECGSFVISGSGAFTLSGGGNIKTSNATGIAGSITTTTKSFSSAANYEFNGAATGTLTTTPTANTVNNLTVNNAAGVILSQVFTVSGNLEIASGKLNPNGLNSSANTMTFAGSGVSNGIWGSTSSDATYKNDNYFLPASTGHITVNTSSCIAPTAFTVTGGGSYCFGGPGVAVGLSGSESGVNYQLFNGASAVGTAIAGNGSTLNFGLQATAGTYTVVATNATTFCTSNMTDNAVITINPLPSAAGAITGFANVTEGSSNVAYSTTAIPDADTYTWAYSGTGVTISGNTNNITLNFAIGATSGQLTVKGHNTCGDGAVSTAFAITVGPGTAPNYTIFSGTGNWTTSANWDPGIPGPNSEAIIDGTATITTAVEVTNLTIYASRKLIIESTGSLTVTGILTNSAGNSGLVIKSGGSLISTSENVAATVERAIEANDWHLISSPMTNASSQLFQGHFLQRHTESTNLYTDLTLPYETLTAGKGFALWGDLPTASFTGNLNAIDVPIGTTSDYADVDPINNKGWNLVGNPFASSIDWDAITKPDEINDAIYIHVDGSTWATYGGGVSVNAGGTKYIASCQGFFVRATANVTLTIPATSRVHNNTAFFKNSDESVPDLVRLEISGNGYNDESVVRLKPEATAEFDGKWDAYKLFGGVAEAPQIYTFGPTPLAINAFRELTTVPVGVRAGTSGTFTIAATEINDLQNVKLEDTKTGIMTDLTSKSYTFDFTAGENEQRFKLHFSSVGVDEKETSSANIYSYQQTVYVNLADNAQGDIYIYNLAGQLVTAKESASGNVRIGLTSTGVYMVKVVTQKETLTQKVVIR